MQQPFLVPLNGKVHFNWLRLYSCSQQISALNQCGHNAFLNTVLVLTVLSHNTLTITIINIYILMLVIIFCFFSFRLFAKIGQTRRKFPARSVENYLQPENIWASTGGPSTGTITILEDNYLHCPSFHPPAWWWVRTWVTTWASTSITPRPCTSPLAPPMSCPPSDTWATCITLLRWHPVTSHHPCHPCQTPTSQCSDVTCALATFHQSKCCRSTMPVTGHLSMISVTLRMPSPGWPALTPA